MYKILTISALLATVSCAGVTDAWADEYTNSPQLGQIKLDKSIQQYANFGKGITIAIVDTGVKATHNELAGRVSSSSTCVATGNCGSGYLDTNFHGTFVASVAAGALNDKGMVGVAPQSTILAVKIAQPSGSAYTTDLNTGLLTAASRGAQVINLSYGSFFGPKTSSSYAALNRSLVTTLNAVAGKGSTTVIAGGNEAKTFMDNVNQTGFTSATLSRLLFVGSVDANNRLSSFSNTPGSTKFGTLDNKVVALNTLWLVAPGENVRGAYITSDTAYAIGAGTSFATPQVSGALALLESRWPTLFKNGTAAQVLLSTATDLGAKGADDIYGMGLMNLNQAFLPVGNLTTPNAKGVQVSLTQLTGTTLASGALGNLSTIQSKLSNISAYDKFNRDFAVNLSGLVQAKSSAAMLSLPHGTQVVGSTYKFADGGGLSYGETYNRIPDYFGGSNDRSSNRDEQKKFFMALTDQSGTTTAAGYGYAATPSFAQALWGFDTASSESAAKLGLSNELLSLAEGGGFMAYGKNLNATTRYALSWSQTAPADSFETSANKDTSGARAIGLGFKHKMSDAWNTGITFNVLDEENQLFGTTYANSAVALGDHHTSVSVGFTSSYDLGEDRTIMFDTAIARSNGARVEDSLVDKVSSSYAQSFGVSFAQKNAFKKGDHFTIELKQPLRIFKGSANVAYTSTDADGNPVTSSETVSLKPDGHEVDLNFGYTAPVKENMSWSANLTARHDEGNIAGNHSVGLMVSGKLDF